MTGLLDGKPGLTGSGEGESTDVGTGSEVKVGDGRVSEGGIAVGTGVAGGGGVVAGGEEVLVTAGRGEFSKLQANERTTRKATMTRKECFG